MFFAALVVSAHAQALEHPGRASWDEGWRRPWTAAAIVGTGSPIGNLGGVIELAPARWLAAGVGAGLSGYLPQACAHLRLRGTFDDFALGAEAGVSTGPYRGIGVERPVQWAQWVNPMMVVEHVGVGGLHWRAFVGAGIRLDVAPHDHRETILLAGLGFGYAWGAP